LILNHSLVAMPLQAATDGNARGFVRCRTGPS
jgi:hypothetical protein